jgi:D-alanyl-lipoteichoic acid acyltransferase DltB (MBOAT superfamily)
MGVPSLEFLAFALLGAVAINLSRAPPWRALVLCSLNLLFFCSFLRGWPSALPFVGFLLLGYLGVAVLRTRKSTALFGLFIAATLDAFFVLKRYDFVPAAVQLPFWYATIGLSYVFFRVMHLLIDVWQGAIEEPVGALSYCNFTLNFTALVSGPIQSYQDYHRFETPDLLPLDASIVAHSGERILRGFFKVTVVSTIVLSWQKSCIGSLSTEEALPARSLDLLQIIGLYPLYLYANFSGYTDFVIGVARLLRIELPENFADPFGAGNFLSFWSRWHMTLSNWLKQYVYTPLLISLMRRFPWSWAELYLVASAYFVTFFLVGAWHGQTSMFLFFGVLQGGGVAINKLYQVAMTAALSRPGYSRLCGNPWYRAGTRGLTYTWFAFTLLWFWCTWPQLRRLATVAGAPAIAAAILMLFVIATLTLAARAYTRLDHWLPGGAGEPIGENRYVRTAMVTAMVVVTVAVLTILGGSPPDLVYKRF